MKLNDILSISEKAIIFLNNNIKPIATPDYIGWFMPLPSKYNCTLVVNYSEDADWDLIPTNPKKKFRLRKVRKAVDFLKKKGWIESATNQPFKEFSPKLEVDMKNCIMIAEKDKATEDEIDEIFQVEPLNYDDDVSDIILQ